jgi:hypothetical protein
MGKSAQSLKTASNELKAVFTFPALVELIFAMNVARSYIIRFMGRIIVGKSGNRHDIGEDWQVESLLWV